MGALRKGTHKGCPYETYWLRHRRAVQFRQALQIEAGPGIGEVLRQLRKRIRAPITVEFLETLQQDFMEQPYADGLDMQVRAPFAVVGQIRHSVGQGRLQGAGVRCFANSVSAAQRAASVES